MADKKIQPTNPAIAADAKTTDDDAKTAERKTAMIRGGRKTAMVRGSRKSGRKTNSARYGG